MNAFQVCFSLACSVALVASFMGCSVGEAVSPGASRDAGGSPAQEGARFVEARKCSQCHQSDDERDGVLSGQTVPQPGTHAYGRNLTPDEETGIGGWSDEALLRAIRAGIDAQGAHLCAPMPHFMSMGDGEGKAIVVYLRSLAPVTRTIPPSNCGADFGDAGEDSSANDDGEIASAEAGADAGLPVWDGGGGVIIVGGDAGAEGGACSMLAPSVTAACAGCTVAHCQPNGCYGGSWCDALTGLCHRKPANCP